MAWSRAWVLAPLRADVSCGTGDAVGLLARRERGEDDPLEDGRTGRDERRVELEVRH